MRTLRILLAGDHAVVRAGVRAELGAGFEVVGEADDAPGAIDVVMARRPDLVLCDLAMPGGGLAVVDAVALVAPIVMFTVSEAERDLLDAVAVGAAGYLLKTTPIAELRAQLRLAAAGDRCSARRSRRSCSASSGASPRPPAPTRSPSASGRCSRSSPRGASYREIGAELVRYAVEHRLS